jgi:molecular chaperone GrpE (heat shock protein)
LKASPATSPEKSETKDSAKPLNNTLKELSQQVSAIREYTTYQQNRLEKLQDGYDWNIVRTFCLRVIRCIDNLENRINQIGEDEAKATHLEEVRDELVFALESSGIEQFRPEINSQYRGQEKYAEAVKDKQPCDQPEQAGKIADVIRPGYQYFINEENIKVVRPAQVKLFA